MDDFKYSKRGAPGSLSWGLVDLDMKSANETQRTRELGKALFWIRVGRLQ